MAGIASTAVVVAMTTFIAQWTREVERQHTGLRDGSAHD
jgi:hypothetical protein